MPLTKYQIRNEYGLADPELYRAADKDDPEALLEGVAMAGLVGLLRQLGDLAEFAAEIFHDLHEEVMATAARGHGLTARVQQLEAEFPLIEKAFLSQTNHSSFFSNTGVDWHPNLCAEHNLVTRGDLPRFVMDSYEECRGPPRLFLLDKFDVAGAGACLKRYTDPSFFQVETKSSGMPAVEVQREKKIRKVKKKGSRWRNGQTPEVSPASHTKLHQLFLEERVANGHSDPARLVKLKRRQLNGFPFDVQRGKSYMEKFLNTLPEQKAICEVSVTPTPLKLPSDISNESGMEIVEISTVSALPKSLEEKESTFSSPDAQEIVLKPSSAELHGGAGDRGLVLVPQLLADGVTDESPSTTHKATIGEELIIHVDGSLDGDHFDDLISEVDNYMDALATMDSEMETDNEHKSKNSGGFFTVGKGGPASDANEEQLDVPANFSDSQSVGNSSIFNDGSESFKKERSSLSNSDSLSNTVDNMQSDSEGAAKVFTASESCVEGGVDLPSDHSSAHVETVGTKSHEFVVYDDACIEKKNICDPEDTSHGSCLVDSKIVPLPSVPVSNSFTVSLAGPELDETSSDSMEISSKSPNTDISETNISHSSALLPNASSWIRSLYSESFPVDEQDHKENNVLSDTTVHISNMPVLFPDQKGSDDSMAKVMQTDGADKIYAESFVEGNAGSPHSIVSTAEQHFHGSDLSEVEMDSAVKLPPESSDVIKLGGVVSEFDEAFAAEGANLKNMTRVVNTSDTGSIEEHQFLDTTVGILQVDLGSTEVGVPYSEEKKIEGTSGDADADERGGLTCNLVEGDVGPFVPANSSNNPGFDEQANLDDVVSEAVQAEDIVAAAAATPSGGDDAGANDFICSSSDSICSSSGKHTDNYDSLSSYENSRKKELDLSEGISSDCLTKQDVEIEVKQLDVSPTYMGSGFYKATSDDYCDQDKSEHVEDPLVVEQTQNSPPSLELSNQELKLNSFYERDSIDTSEDAVNSSTCHSPEVGTSLEQSIELQADKIDVESVQFNEANCELVNLQIPSTFCTVEPEIPLKRSMDLQSSETDEPHLEADEVSPQSSIVQMEHPQTESCMDQDRHIDNSSKSCLVDLSMQELLLNSGHDLNDTKLAINPFHSFSPSFTLHPQATTVNLEEMPPLPPLPPMQWRIGKVQPAPPTSHGEWNDHGRDALPLTESFTANGKGHFDFPSEDGEIIQPPNLFLSLAIADSKSSQQLSTEFAGDSLLPNSPSFEMPTIVNDRDGEQDCLQSEGKQSSNPFVTSPEKQNERPDHGSFASGVEKIGSSLPNVEHGSAEYDPVPLEGSSIDPLLSPKKVVEANVPEQGSGHVEGNKGNSSDESPVVEEQLLHDVVPSQDETTWSQNTLVLPPNVSMANGNKLPRNPLIDAVAAHDKSKLRKVTERVRLQIGPKPDERDSLLEQIRTKSFNLKPATLTRPSIKGIRGPKTNLKVAAILEKANAIRQALAGSDGDDDSDSWSDS